MATVPVYTPKVENRPIGLVPQTAVDVQNNAGRDLVAFGRGIGNAADVAMSISLKEQQEDNERALKQAEITFQAARDAITSGDGTEGNPGFYNMKGDNAVNASQSTRERLGKAREDVAATITNKRVAELFGQLSQAQLNRELETVSRHTAKERMTANNAVSVARIDSYINRAAARYNDPQEVGRALAVIESETKGISSRLGETGEVAQSRAEDAKGKLFSHVIANAAMVSAKEATAIYGKYMNEIPGDVRHSIERQLKIATNAERVQAEHDRMLARQAAAERAQRVFSSYVNDYMNGKGINLKEVGANPAFAEHGDLKLRIMSMVNAGNKTETLPARSALTEQHLFDRMTLPVGNPSRLVTMDAVQQEFIAGNLTREGYNWLAKQFQDLRTPEGESLTSAMRTTLDSVKSSITRSVPLGAQDPGGDRQWGVYQHWVADRVAQYRKENKDPHELFNPSSKDYVGSPGALAPFKRSLQDYFNDLREGMQRRPTGAGVAPSTVSPPVGPGGTLAQEDQAKADLKRAVKEGTITREEADQIAIEKGWIRR